MIMKRNNKYWSRLAGFLSGELSSAEEKKFLDRVKRDGQLNNDYNLMKNKWKTYTENPDNKYRDTEGAWKRLSEKISDAGMDEDITPVRHLTGLQYTLRIAAVIILILAVGIPALYFSNNEFGQGNSAFEHRAENGTLTVDLPDGSRVFLNEGSKLEYRKNFEEQRNVTLEGEGFFDVMSDPNRPFRVNTGKVVVTVLGTSFNIRESENKSVQVFVESGKVQVAMKDSEEAILLEPGQLGVANGHLERSEVVNDNYLSWKTKDFKFVDESVGDILSVLKEAYHVDIEYNNINLSDRRLTTTYNGQSFDAILNTICTALDIQYHKEGKVYILQTN